MNWEAYTHNKNSHFSTFTQESIFKKSLNSPHETSRFIIYMHGLIMQYF